MSFSMSTKVSKKETTVGSGESLNMFRVMMEQNQFGDDVLLIRTTKSYIFFWILFFVRNRVV